MHRVIPLMAERPGFAPGWAAGGMRKKNAMISMRWPYSGSKDQKVCLQHETFVSKRQYKDGTTQDYHTKDQLETSKPKDFPPSPLFLLPDDDPTFPVPSLWIVRPVPSSRGTGQFR